MNRERHNHALDNCSRLVGSLGPWIRHLLHHGRFRAHFAGSSRRDGCYPTDPGSKSASVRPAHFTNGVALNRLIAGVLLVALSCIPAIAQAEVTRGQRSTAGEIPGNVQALSVPLDISAGSASDYAAREATAPELAQFAGGGGGLYIGTGALVVGLIVLIVILAVH